MEGDAGAGGSDVALRAHGRRVRAGPRGAGRGRCGAALLSRQLLSQRQADRRRRGTATVRRRTCQWDERQGGESAQSDSLDQRPGRQGELRAPPRSLVSVHGGGLKAPLLGWAMAVAFLLLVAALLIGSFSQPAVSASAIGPPAGHTLTLPPSRRDTR